MYVVDNDGKQIGQTNIKSGFKEGILLVDTPAPSVAHKYDRERKKWVEDPSASLLIDVTGDVFEYSGTTMRIGATTLSTCPLIGYSKIAVVDMAIVFYDVDGMVVAENKGVLNKAFQYLLDNEKSIVIESTKSRVLNAPSPVGRLRKQAIQIVSSMIVDTYTEYGFTAESIETSDSVVANELLTWAAKMSLSVETALAAGVRSLMDIVKSLPTFIRSV